MSFHLSSTFPYLIAGGFTVLFILLGILVYSYVKKTRTVPTYEEQLQELLVDDTDQPNVTGKVGVIERWNRHWGTVLQGAGVSRYSGDNSTAGRDMLLLGLVIAALGSVLTSQPLVGPVLAVALLYGISMMMRMRYNRKTDDLNQQIPGFLFALKANIQASDTNERAILKIVDSMPSPLYDDLVIVKHRLLANGSFREAMEELSARTTSRDLKFLCACMIQATASGANMINQIDSIQKVLESRRQVSDEINRAVKAVQPAIYLASVVIPALFLASYFTDATARDFWFVEPMSWVSIVVTLALYIAGMILTKRQIDKIKNM